MNGLGTFCGTSRILLPAGLLIWGLKLTPYSSFSSVLLPSAVAHLLIFNKDSFVGHTCLLLAGIWSSIFSSSPNFLSITVPFVLSDDLLNILMISTQDVTIDYPHHISSLILDTESPFSSTFCFIWSCDGLLLPLTGQSFGSSHQLMSANLIFPLLFHCMPLSTSLWTPDIFLDILFLGAYQMTGYGTNFCWMLSGYIQPTTVLCR